MKARNLPGRVLFWLTLCVPSPLFATSAATRWENTFHRVVPGVGNQSVLLARELADGTTLTVVQDNYGLTALQYDHSGNQIHGVTFYSAYPFYLPSIVAIDPFGAVFVASYATAGYGYESDVWLMKFDGLSGAGLWPAAVIFGSGNGASDSPLNVFIDLAGDVILYSSTDYSSSFSLTKYRGDNGQQVWGPVVTSSENSICQIDSAGDLYIASHDSLAGSSFHFEKYARSTGAVVWSLVEVGHDLSPVAIGFDGSGNAVVTGGATSVAGNFEADKYSGATGQKIWGPAIWAPPAGNDGTAPDRAAVASDGSVVIFGHTSSNSQSSKELLKFRGADGALQWSSVQSTDSNEVAFGSTLTLAGNGDAVLSAQIYTGQNSWDANMWRYDVNTGNPVWGPAVSVNASVGASFVGSNGRVFVGLTVSNGTDEDAAVLERDGGNGSESWGPTSFTGEAAGYAYLWDLRAAPDGNVVVTGVVPGADGHGEWATFKYERATGGTLWGPVYFPSAIGPTFSPWGVLIDPAGDALVAGVTAGGMTVVKYSGATGAALWTWTAAPGAFTTSFALDASGNGAIVGYLWNGSGYDAVAAKVAGATGTSIWGPITYDSGSDDFPDWVAADASGNVVVAGHSNVVGPPSFLVEYAAADGSVVWGPTLQDDYATWLATDASGDVFRESYSASSAGIITTKYQGTTGAPLWGPLTVGSFEGSGVALAVDAAGDVLVAGALYTGQTYDYAILKYHGSDGSLLWGPVTYDGGGSDWPYGIVVDGSGNAVVTGTSQQESGEYRSATLSYDGATGVLRWGPIGRNIARSSVNGLAAAGSTIYVGATRPDLGYIADAIDESLGIITPPGILPAASCGHAIDIPLGAANGMPPYSWSIVSGGLPPAVVLGAGGDLIGTPQEEGVFSFTVQVQDAKLATATKSYTLAVGPGGPLVPVTVARDDACQLTLSVEGSYTAYDWLPGGQATPQIVVDPTEPTPYGVVLNDGTPCRVRGAVTIVPFDPSCVSPSVVSIAPGSGPDAGTPVVVSGAKFDANAALTIGGLPAAGVVFENASALQATTPVLAPGTVADVLVVNPDGRYGLLLRAFAADFLDVPSSNPFYADVMRVLRAGITAGCGSGAYCPSGSVTRAQMAVFLLKAQHGFFYVPPPCTGIFGDVACPGAFAADWIEQLSIEGITGGCGGGNYCPGAPVTREQMAAFLLKAEHGSSFVPPPCEGVFGDVPCSSPFASWIEQLYAESITGGCGNGNYCPSNPNTRAQMATFLSKTFGIP